MHNGEIPTEKNEGKGKSIITGNLPPFHIVKINSETYQHYSHLHTRNIWKYEFKLSKVTYK